MFEQLLCSYDFLKFLKYNLYIECTAHCFCKERAPSNFAFQAWQRFIGTLNRKNFWNTVSPFWENPLFVLWLTLILQIWRTLEHVMNIFRIWHFHNASKEVVGPKKDWISGTGRKVPFWQFFNSAKYVPGSSKARI